MRSRWRRWSSRRPPATRAPWFRPTRPWFAGAPQDAPSRYPSALTPWPSRPCATCRAPFSSCVSLFSGGRTPLDAPPGRPSPLAAAAAAPPRLLDRVRAAARVRHFSLRTEDAYAGWVRRFVLFHGKRHPQELGAAEVNAFLTDLAVN